MKELLTNFRTWIAVIILLAAIILAVVKYQQLPERVDKVEARIDATDDNIDKLADNVDLFIMEQRTIQKEQNKREELMLEILKNQ